MVHVTFRNRRFLSISRETWESRQLKIPVADVEQIHDLSTKMMFSRRSSLRQSIFHGTFQFHRLQAAQKGIFFCVFSVDVLRKQEQEKLGAAKSMGERVVKKHHAGIGGFP